MPPSYSSRQHYACLGLVLLPATALTFMISTLLCQHLQHSLSCVRIEHHATPRPHTTHVDSPPIVRIFVQPLPPSLFGLTPGDAEPFFAQHFSAPLGSPLNGTDLSLCNTSQSATDAHFWAQLLKSPLRVASEEHADLTFVPCPVALYLYASARGAINDTLANVFGEYMSAIATPGGPPLLLGCVRPLRELPLVLAPETPTHRRVFYLVGSSVNERALHLQDNMVAVPYPSNRHNHPGATRPLAWVHAAHRTLLAKQQVHRAADANATAAVAPERRLQQVLEPWTPPGLVSMIFSWPFNSLQAAVYEDCDARPAACRSAAWDHGHPLRIAAAVQSAWYCLLPPGDEWSRKQLWDCVSEGAIPVVFHDDTLQAMPFRHAVPWEDILVVGASEEQVLIELVNVVDAVQGVLRAEGHEGALQRLAVLRRVWHLLQYSLAPCHTCVRWDALHAATMEDDAFSMMLKAVAAKI